MTNDERSAATQALVLDATIEALVRYGYHGATSARIAEISGLSRGAQLHHWKTKAELVVAALDYLHEKQLTMYDERWSSSTKQFSIEWLVEELWKSLDDPIWLAASELWTAARTDEELRSALIPAERSISKRIMERMSPRITGDGSGFGLHTLPPQRAAAIFGLIWSALRGIAAHESFDPNPRRAKAQRTELTRALNALVALEDHQG